MSPADWVPVLTLEHERGSTSIFRDARDRHWLGVETHDGTLIESHDPVLIGLDDDAVVVGGVLPPGATEALCRDGRGEMRPARTGSGAWIVCLEEHDMFLEIAALFRDASGALVPRPLPDGATIEGGVDADEACPACAAREWQRVRWTQRWEDEGLEEERSGLRCVSCGQPASDEGFVAIAIGETTDEAEDGDAAVAAEPPPEWLERTKREGRGAFRKAKFAVYGVASWEGPRFYSGSSRSGRRLTSVSLRHGDLYARGPYVDVETSARAEDWRSDRELCRDALASMLLSGSSAAPGVERSHSAMSLWFAGREREHRERAARAAAATTEIAVDGEPVPFYMLADEGRWTACGRVGAVRIVVSAADVPATAVELATITDPAPYL